MGEEREYPNSSLPVFGTSYGDYGGEDGDASQYITRVMCWKHKLNLLNSERSLVFRESAARGQYALTLNELGLLLERRLDLYVARSPIREYHPGHMLEATFKPTKQRRIMGICRILASECYLLAYKLLVLLLQLGLALRVTASPTVGGTERCHRISLS